MAPTPLHAKGELCYKALVASSGTLFLATVVVKIRGLARYSIHMCDLDIDKTTFAILLLRGAYRYIGVSKEPQRLPGT